MFTQRDWKRIVEALESMADSLEKIEAKINPPVPRAAFVFFDVVDADGTRRRVKDMVLGAGKKLQLKLAIEDDKGNPAKVDGLPKWDVSDASLGQLTIDEDGMGAVLESLGKVGQFKVSVICDADLGEGVIEIFGELDLDVPSGQATKVSIVATEIPEPVPVP